MDKVNKNGFVREFMKRREGWDYRGASGEAAGIPIVEPRTPPKTHSRVFKNIRTNYELKKSQRMLQAPNVTEMEVEQKLLFY